MIRIALTGVHGSGKDTLATHIKNLLVDHGVVAHEGRVAVLPSATRRVAKVTGEKANGPELGTTDWLQLWSAVQRRLWQFEADAAVDAVVSPRTGLDEVAYQGIHLNDQQKEVQRRIEASSGLVLPPVPGQDPNEVRVALDEDTSKRLVLSQRSQLVMNLLVEQATDEATWWDAVYLKRRNAAVEIVADGVRPTDQEFTDRIQRQLDHFIFESPVKDHLAPLVTPLPDDLEEAKAFLAHELPRWREIAEKNSPSDAGVTV